MKIPPPFRAGKMGPTVVSIEPLRRANDNRPSARNGNLKIFITDKHNEKVWC
jgi:hypothetical protein